jgi:hypothetical protein
VQPLNFPSYKFRFKNSENKAHIFDKIRKKFVVLQPEEWVRQHCINFLNTEKKYPLSLINVEKLVVVKGIKKRYDIVVFNSDGTIHLLVECKSPKVDITQDTFDQIARYNLQLKASFLMVTNGINHYYCTMDFATQSYRFLKTLPPYNNLN